jgi:hypothetical protein
MSLRERTRPGAGIVQPCLPSPAKAPPSGPGWLHEIKHDGFRILALRDNSGVRLITRARNDFSSRFPFIAIAVSNLPVRSCVIDGEAIVCDEDGSAVFELIRHPVARFLTGLFQTRFTDLRRLQPRPGIRHCTALSCIYQTNTKQISNKNEQTEPVFNVAKSHNGRPA